MTTDWTVWIKQLRVDGYEPEDPLIRLCELAARLPPGEAERVLERAQKPDTQSKFVAAYARGVLDVAVAHRSERESRLEAFVAGLLADLEESVAIDESLDSDSLSNLAQRCHEALEGE